MYSDPYSHYGRYGSDIARAPAQPNTVSQQPVHANGQSGTYSRSTWNQTDNYNTTAGDVYNYQPTQNTSSPSQYNSNSLSSPNRNTSNTSANEYGRYSSSAAPGYGSSSFRDGAQAQQQGQSSGSKGSSTNRTGGSSSGVSNLRSPRNNNTSSNRGTVTPTSGPGGVRSPRTPSQTTSPTPRAAASPTANPTSPAADPYGRYGLTSQSVSTSIPSLGYGQQQQHHTPTHQQPRERDLPKDAIMRLFQKAVADENYYCTAHELDQWRPHTGSFVHQLFNDINIYDQHYQSLPPRERFQRLLHAKNAEWPERNYLQRTAIRFLTYVVEEFDKVR